MRRLILPALFLFITLAWILGSQTWMSVIVIDSGKTLSATGLESYPQLGFTLVIWLFIAMFSSYLKSLFSKFIFSAVSVLLFATLFPVWFDSAAENLAPLLPLLRTETGVGDLGPAMQLVENIFYAHLIADSFVICVILALVLILFRIWSTASGEQARVATTRIDKLPKW